ncbi:MFS transporter [Vulgatibacter sp.]|uniref:MFS transporter n=1 Tax=Vulgatibacter sp. TaxID=1971226 RepID=UPI003564666B
MKQPTTRRKRRQLYRTLRYSSAEGMVAELVTSFVGGSVLTGWAIFLGCSPLVIAMLGALPFLAQLVQFPSAWLTSSLGSRRVAIAGYALGRLVYAPLVALPFLPVAEETRRWILMAVAGLAAIFTVVGTNAWVAWMGEVVPVALRGRYFGKRLSLVTITGAAGALSAGLLLDVSRRGGWEPVALAGLAALACVAGLVTLFLLRRHQDVPVEVRRGGSGFDLGAAIAALRDPASRPFLRYQLAWNAAIGISASFFAVHMLTNLKMGFALIAAHGVAVAVMRVLVSPLWGKVIDRIGARPVLVVTSFALPVVPLIWLLPTAESRFVALALDVILAGGLWAGHMLAAFELPLAVAPRERRPYYLAAFSTAGGLAFAAASAVGGLLAQGLPETIHLFGGSLSNLHVLFVISAAGRLLSAPLALGITEPGARPVEHFFRLVGERLQTRRAQLARVLAFARR